MSCKVKYNKNGKIETVFTPKGEESSLFKQFAKMPFNTNETALEAYKQTLGTESDVEPQAYYKVGDNFYNTYKEALLNTNGEDISIIVGENEIQRVSSNTNPNTKIGLVNNAIKSDILSDVKILEDGESYFKAEGYSELKQLTNEQVLKQFGYENKTSIKTTLDGKITIERLDEGAKFRGKSFNEISSEIGAEGAVRVITYDVIGKEISNNRTEIASEDTLVSQTISLLNKAGFKITTIDSYKNNYATKNGVEPNAQALIDLTNKVVAFAEGQVNADTVTEEFSHLMLEAIPQEELTDALREVQSTEEYAQFSEMYRKAYSKDTSLSEAEVETKVQKEILGKILAKGIQNQLTPKSQNIFEFLLNKILDFFKSLNISNQQKQFREQVNSLTESAIRMLMTQDATQLQGDFQNLTFYSLNNAPSSADINIVNKQLHALLATLRDQEKALRKGRFTNTQAIEQVKRDIGLVEAQSSILASIDFVNKQLKYAEQSINEAQRQGTTITPEQRVLTVNLKGNILDTVTKLGHTIKDDVVLNRLTNELNDIKLRIVNLDSSVSEEVKDSIFKRAMIRHKMPAEIEIGGKMVSTEDYFKKAVDEVSEDTNAIYTYIGQLSHAKDPLLNLLDSVIFDMHYRANTRFTQDVKDFQQRLRDLGFTEKDLKDFYEGNGFITSLWDFKKLEDETQDIIANNFFTFLSQQKQSKGEQMTLTLEDIKSKLKNNEAFKTEDTLEGTFQEAYSKQVSSELGQLRERAYSDKYYEDNEAKMQALNIPKEAIMKIRQLNFDRADIMSRVEMIDGLPVIRQQEKIDLDTYNTERAGVKSLFNNEGKLKEGLIVLTEIEFKQRYPEAKGNNIMDNDFVKVGSNYISLSSNPSTEAKIAYGISKMDADYFDTLGNQPQDNKTQLPQKFVDMLNKFTSAEAMVDFFLTNTNLSVNESYFSEQDDVLAPHFGKDTVFDEAYKRLSELQTQRKELLKRFKDSKNATNVLASKMSESQLESIKSLTTEIVEKRKTLFEMIGEKPTPFELDPTMQSTVNEDYKGQLRDLGIENNYPARLNFALKHISGNSNFSMLIGAMNMLKQSPQLTPFLENTLQKALDSLGVDISQINQEIAVIKLTTGLSKAEKDSQINDVVNKYAVQMAEQRLAPYYKTIAPNNVSNIMDSLNNETDVKNVIPLIESLNQAGMDMRVHHSFYDTVIQNPNANDKFKKGFLANSLQPRYEKFANINFESKLGVTIVKDSQGQPVFDEYGIPEVVSTNNKFELWKEFIKFQAKTVNNTNSLGQHNIYLAPQVSKTNIDKISSVFANNKNIQPLAKELWKEFTSFRVDEQMQGETTEDGESLFAKTGLRVVPKRYFNRLESVEDVSSDLFYSATLMRKESEVHKARKESMSEVTALEDMIRNKKFKNGKASEATNTWKMAKSYIDYNMYGISEVANYRTKLPILGTIDFAKVARMFHNFVRWKNLAFNWLIPTTSWLTAEVNIGIEQWVGQYLDKDSTVEARRLTAKLFAESAKETLSLKTKGRLNVLGEYLDVFEMNANFADSDKSSFITALKKIPMGGHSAGNFSPVSQAMIAGLKGHRLYNGSFYDKKQFERDYKYMNVNSTQAEIDNKWKELRDVSLYDYLDTDSGKVQINYQGIADKLGEVNDEAFREKFELEIITVNGKIKKFIERIDGNIPQHEKTMLQRNYLGTFAMTHKGWLSILISNRFKSAHFNQQTGLSEEGSYISVARRLNMVSDSVKNSLKDKRSITELLKLAKDAFYKDATSIEKTNLQRTAKDLAITSIIFTLGAILSGFADDDENKDNAVIQVASILTNRVFNETKSASTGVAGEIISTLEEPIVGFKNLVKTLDVTEALNFGEESNKYRGSSKSYEYFADNLPFLKNMHVSSSGADLNNYRKKYEFYNEPDNWNVASIIATNKEIKEMIYGE